MAPTHPLQFLTRPRSELPRLVEQRSPSWFLLFAVLVGVERELSDLYLHPSPERALRPLSEVLALHALLGSVRGLAVLSVLAVLVATATRLMKHPIDNRRARAILGWASLLVVFSIAIRLGMFAVHGAELLRIGSDGVKASAPVLWWGLALLELVLGIWSLTLVLNGIAGVSKMSGARSLGAYLLAAVTLWALTNLVLFALQWLLPGPLEVLKGLYERY